MKKKKSPKDWSPHEKKPKKYIVSVREVHIQMVEIEAQSEEDAIAKVADGEGEAIEGGLEYSHTLDPDVWTVEEAS